MEIDKAAWRGKSWREIDHEIGIDSLTLDSNWSDADFDLAAYYRSHRDKNPWPSSTVLREDLESDVVYTW
jgi:hypothetical protein